MADTVSACAHWLDAQWTAITSAANEKQEPLEHTNPVAEAITSFVTWLETDDPEWGDYAELANGMCPSDSAPPCDERSDPPGLAAHLSSIWSSPAKPAMRSPAEPVSSTQRHRRRQLQRRVSLWNSMNNGIGLAKHSAVHQVSDANHRQRSPRLSTAHVCATRRRSCRHRKSDKCCKMSMRAFMAVAQECRGARSHSLPAKLPDKLRASTAKMQLCACTSTGMQQSHAIVPHTM